MQVEEYEGIFLPKRDDNNNRIQRNNKRKVISSSILKNVEKIWEKGMKFSNKELEIKYEALIK